MKMFYLGRGAGRKGGPKFLLDQRTPSSSSLKVTRGKKKKEGGGRSKQTKKIINHFVRRSDPAIILVSNKWCKRSQAWVSMG